ncbi:MULTISPECIES: type I polyketide synthase [unclassified Streptomyces]|uniref:type I polyketide synthase n=1 Tax=unclassified Streptomyces TaxID=2593676 RepID=UPI0036E3118F
MAEGFVQGLGVDWGVCLPQSCPVGLPTYAFQHQRYWLDVPQLNADAASAGQRTAQHRVLSAIVAPADEDALVLTGRLSLQTHPWLADHAALGRVLMPATGFGELALYAGDQVGCSHVRELTFEEPLLLSGTGAVHVQVLVGTPADETGARPVSVYSRPESDTDLATAGALWRCHARGELTHDNASGDEAELGGAWPPPGAEPMPVEEMYERVAAMGYEYGPVFAGVRAAWVLGDEVYADVALPDDESLDGFLLHPALLDASLHPVLFSGAGKPAAADSEQGVELPFVWSGVELYATDARAVRVRLRPPSPELPSVTVADPTGAPVFSVREVVMRPVSARQLGQAMAAGDGLFQMNWVDAELTGDDDNGGLTGEGAGANARAGAAQWPRIDLPQGGELGDDLLAGAVVQCTVTGSAPDLVTATHALTADVLALVQGWLAADTEAGAARRLVLVTRHAVAVDGDEGVGDLAAAAVWGLLRTVEAEHPGRVTVVDIDDDPVSAGAIPQLVAAGHPQSAVRRGRALVPRLARVGTNGRPARATDQSAPVTDEAVPATDRTAASADRTAAGTDRTAASADLPTPGLWGTGTVLITGGTGMAGGVIAEHLARSGARDLLLVSRTGDRTPGTEDLVARLAEYGAAVHVTACDVGDREALATLLEGIPADRPLTAVIHAAGALDDGAVSALTTAQLDRVLAPKVDAAWNLHELTRDHDLAAFVMFSSLTGTLGGPGQGNYAAANAFVDALAADRRANGLPGVSLVWGHWAQTSAMTSHLQSDYLARSAARAGIRSLTADAVRTSFDAAMADGLPVLLLTEFDTASLAAQAAAGTLPATLRGLVRVPVRRVAAAAPSGARSALAQRLAGMDTAAREELLLDLVRTHVAAVLGHSGPDDIVPTRPFAEVGFDSLTAIELRNRLAAATGLQLPATTAFDYPAPDVLAGRLLTRLLDTLDDSPQPVVRAAGRSVADDDPIAIVAMSCRYPGGADSAEDLWHLVVSGTDSIGPFPNDRGWDVEGLYDPEGERPGTCSTSEAGFLSGVADFDAAFFGISPREALAMDPQQRLLMETAWELMERAQIDPAELRGSDTGVFIGGGSQDYGPRLGEESQGVEGYLLTGTASSVASGRVAYTFGFEGPAVTVDTACSSSLVALHMASQALRAGDCSLAVAGGVTVFSNPGVFVEFSRQRGLAPDGRCKSFAAAADGTSWGEGVGLLLVERLSDARRRGHPVLAVVRGSAINQDGASNGLSAPNGPSQQRVIRQALANAHLTTDDVDTVEAHGTGTRLGDPIEAQALLDTYGQGRSADHPLWLGSIKSNIGHTAGAAGVAGVIKMVMAMRHGLLPASLHVDSPTPFVDWSSGAVRLLTGNERWPDRSRPRRAGVSSFGISGTNAHVILEHVPEPARSEEPAQTTRSDEQAESAGAGSTAVPWIVSGRSRAALLAQAAALAEFVAANPDLDRTRVAVALLKTRSTFGWRACVLGSTREELRAGLDALVHERPDPRLIWHKAPVAGKRRRTAMLFACHAPGGDVPAGELPGRELVAHFPVFARAFDETRAATAGVAGRAAARFAFEVALFRLVREFGVQLDQLTGDGIGEITAAHLAGVLDLPSACALLAAWPASPSGTPGRAAEVERFAEVASSLTYHAPGTPLWADGADITTAEHWSTLPDAPSAVAEGVEQLQRDGVSVFLSSGLDDALTGLVDEATRDSRGAVSTFLIRSAKTEPESILTGLATLLVHGVPVDLEKALPADPARPVELPTYRFQRRRYWLSTALPSATVDKTHPLLGRQVELADPFAHWYAQSLTSVRSALVDTHPLVHSRALSAAAVIEWAVAAARAEGAHPHGPGYLRDLRFTAPVPVDAGRTVEMQTRVAGADGPVHISGYGRSPGDAWAECLTVAAAGPLAPLDEPSTPADEPLTPPDEPSRRGVSLTYPKGGVNNTEWLSRTADEALALVAAPEGGNDPACVLNTAVLEACLQRARVFAESANGVGGGGGAWVPAVVEHVDIWAPLPDTVLCHVRTSDGVEPGEHSVDLELMSEAEEPLMTLRRLSYRPADTSQPAPRSRTERA